MAQGSLVCNLGSVWNGTLVYKLYLHLLAIVRMLEVEPQFGYLSKGYVIPLTT